MLIFFVLSALFFLGSPSYPNSGTTNLHLDISDAVNVMVSGSIASLVLRQHHIMETGNDTLLSSVLKCFSHSMKLGEKGGGKESKRKGRKD